MKKYTYTIRPYSDADYDFIYTTKKNAYKKYVEEIWGWNEEKQKEMFIEFINTYGKDIMIILYQGHKIGFFHCENLENNGYEIGNICIIPEYQGKGIGTQVLKNILYNNKYKDIYLRYFKQNPVVNLYKRLGFKIIEELPFHYKMVLIASENTIKLDID